MSAPSGVTTRSRRGLAAAVALAALAAGLGATGCAVGPSFRPEPVVAPVAKVGAPVVADSTRRFFDSLATAHAADAEDVAAPPARAVTADADLKWLDVLNDSVMLGLVRTAVRQNRDLALARARIEEFRSQSRAAWAPIFPRVTGNLSTGTNQAAFGASPPIQYDAVRATADVAWELDLWGRTRRGVQAAGADLAAQRAAEQATTLSLVSDVSSGYLQLLELDEEQAIAQRTLADRRTTLDLARARYAQGIISELDVRQFEAQLAVPAARLAQVERLRAQQENSLSVLMGEAPHAIPRGRSLIEAAREVTVPDSLPVALLERRPDVEQARQSYAAASARIGVAEAGRFPTLSVVGYLGGQAPTADNVFHSQSQVYQLQAGVSIPLFTGGRVTEDVRAARARADESKAVFERTTLTALREASDALAGARAGREEVAADQTQAVALRRALELADLRYQTGVASYVEVLDAQRSLFDAELALAQASLRQLQATVQLYKALGGSWTP